jgi:hypothetical protein
MAIPKEYLESDYDFGFTTEDTQGIISTHEATVDEYKQKLKAVEKLIVPLLVNLMKNPDVDTIKWPGRAPIIEKQIEKILAITRS